MQVGAFEAKTNLGRLLDLVEHKGETITITRHGNPVAILCPAAVKESESRAKAVRKIQEFRIGKRLGGLSIRELAEEGRRF